MNMPNYFTYHIVIFGFAFYVFICLLINHRKFTRELNIQETAIKVSPNRINFIFSFLVLCLLMTAPIVFIFYMFTGFATQKIGIFLIDILISFLLFSIPLYPFYCIVVNKDQLTGASASLWRWKRIAFQFTEIDNVKSFQKRSLHKLGILLIHSTCGKKF